MSTTTNIDLYMQELEDSKVEIKRAIIAKGVTPSGGLSSYADAIGQIVSGTLDPSYAYKTGLADVTGLKAIGWDDISIAMYRDNNLGYHWQAGEFTVSDENKALYGAVNADTDMDTVEGMKYLPMIDTSGKMSMRSMFQGCSSLAAIPQLDTSSVTDMYNMFKNCSSLQSIPQLDTSSVTDMFFMFSDCSNLTTIPLLNTSSVTSMSNMFGYCSNLTAIPQLDTSSVTSMSGMFQSCSSLTTIPQLDTSSVTSMSQMFYGCSNLTTLPDFNCVKVTDFGSSSFSSWLAYCSNIQKIGIVDCDSVTNIGYFFGNGSRSKLTEFGGCRNLGKASSVSNTNSSYFMDYVPNLNYESVMNVINGLYDRATAGLSVLTLKLHANQLAMLSEDDIAIATNKGWTIV